MKLYKLLNLKEEGILEVIQFILLPLQKRNLMPRQSLNYQVTDRAVTFFHMMLRAIVRLRNGGMVQQEVVLVSCSLQANGLEVFRSDVMGLGSGETSLYKCSGPGEHISFLIFQEILYFFLPHSTNYTNAKFTESESTGVEPGHRDFKTNSLGVFDV